MFHFKPLRIVASKKTLRSLSSSSTSPPTIAAGWKRFSEHGREMAPLYGVMLTVFGAVLGASILTSRTISDLQSQSSKLQTELNRVEAVAKAENKAAEAQIRAARAEAIADTSNKFLMYGFAEEYNKFREKTISRSEKEAATKDKSGKRDDSK
jgi:hypothetical protein